MTVLNLNHLGSSRRFQTLMPHIWKSHVTFIDRPVYFCNYKNSTGNGFTAQEAYDNVMRLTAGQRSLTPK